MDLQEFDVITNGIRLHGYRTGSPKPPLVFAHGITDNGLCFLPFASQLADLYEIILYDARGHGKSEGPTFPSTWFDRAEDLAGLVAALGLEKPGLVGHSMGAITVAFYAGLHPQMPGRIVLEDPPPLEMLAARHSSDQPWRLLAAANKQKNLPELVEISRRENPAWPEAEREPWALAKQQMSLSIFEEGPFDFQQAQQVVSQIACPVLILTADLDKGSLFPPQAAEKLAASLPRARHINIPGAGHSIRREQPAAYFKAVSEFLQESL
jgi:N-formylmaleamate deformylase